MMCNVLRWCPLFRSPETTLTPDVSSNFPKSLVLLKFSHPESLAQDHERMAADNEGNVHPSPFPSNSSLSSVRQQWFTIILAYTTATCVLFTLFFAYNSCLDYPVWRGLIFARPERTVWMLNILSQVSIFLLAELTSSIFDITRWALASRDTGIPAYTFLVLSRATSIIGVVSLLLARTVSTPRYQFDGHRFWGIQRYVSRYLAFIEQQDRICRSQRCVRYSSTIRPLFQINLSNRTRFSYSESGAQFIKFITCGF